MGTIESQRVGDPVTWVNSKTLRDAWISRGVYRFGVCQLLAAVIVLIPMTPKNPFLLLPVMLISCGLGAVTTNVNKMH